MSPIKSTSQTFTPQLEDVSSPSELQAKDLAEYEHRIQKQNWALTAYSLASSALTHAQNTEELCQNVAAAIVKQNAYILSWVGLLVHDEHKTVDVAGVAGGASKYVEGIQVSWDAASPLGHGPMGVSIQTGESQVAQDILSDDAFQPWRESASKYGIRSSIAVPIFDSGHPIGALMVYSKVADAFGNVEVTLFENLANEIGYGLKSLERQQALKFALIEREKMQDKLLVSLKSTIEAMSRTMEWRDPYTAGHQKRVANIAAAIGHEMGWDDDRIQGLYMGAMVHDIGKVAVPAEILTKPTRLTPIEMKLVQVHPETGYQILKDLPFSWPIADMVRQHHEHMDGSGYPLGLKGEEILPEARVLAVADMIEAMSSHRPYRPARGMEAALAEVKATAGKFFDTEVVDAAFRVIEKHPNLFEPH
jgi:putative methionine-R-sulfoxide reductase with GAF domain